MIVNDEGRLCYYCLQDSKFVLRFEGTFYIHLQGEVLRFMYMLRLLRVGDESIL